MARESKHFTCVICPIGCEIDVQLEDGNVVSMEGNKCEKSEEFVLQELKEPMRILTTTVRIKGAKWAMLPVRTDEPIPRRLLFKVIEELANIEMQAPVKVSDVIISDIAGTGANIVATRNMKRERKGRPV
jgi:CxxC motif-containing protein